MSMALDLASLWTKGSKPSYFEWMIKTTLLYKLINIAYLHCRKMAEATNFTEDVLQKIKKELSCSPQYNPKVDNELKLLSALNIFLSITAFLGDTLVLVALHRETSLHPPSKLLYRNLAITAWSPCWYHCGTSSCYLLDFCGERELEDLLLRRFDRYFDW